MLITSLVGMLTVGMSYFVVFFVTGFLYYSPLNLYWIPQMGIDMGSALVQGPALLTVPYALGGFAIAYFSRSSPLTSAALIATSASMLERLGVFLLALPFYLRGGDGTMNGITLHRMIVGEALPYFTEAYVFFLWPLSVIVCVGAAYIACKVLSLTRPYKGAIK